MCCGHRVGAMTKSVQAVDASAKVDIDLATQKVRIASTTNRADIKSAVIETGYPVLSSTAV